MKEWQVTLGGAIVMFAAGLGMFLWANSADVPSSFLGGVIGLENYVLVHNQSFIKVLTGALFTGFGGGLLLCTLLIYQLEKKLEST